MGLSTLINSSLNSTVSDDQGSWRTYILDHLDYLNLRSEVFAIEPELMNIYRYDLKRFLKDYMKRHEDIAWIVLLMNNLANDFSFDTAMNIIIPTDRLVLNLHMSYVTVTSNSN
jgi:hypothetical protein